MKWLPTILAILSMGCAGILPSTGCAMPESKPAISKGCSCCGGGGACCVKSSPDAPTHSVPVASLPASPLQGILYGPILCVGQVAEWTPEPTGAFAHGQMLRDSRRMYQRIQVFLI